MSRQTEWTLRGMTPEKVADFYREGGNLPEAARLAGVSRKTFWTWTKAANLTLERGRPLRHRSCLVKWIKAHPDRRLPISPSRIASMTDCSIDSVKSYLKRRRGLLAKWVRSLPDLRSIRGVSLLTTEGYALPLIAIRDYSISIPRLRLRIAGHLRSGKPFTIATTREGLSATLYPQSTQG